jgi:hypothetical protein
MTSRIRPPGGADGAPPVEPTDRVGEVGEVGEVGDVDGVERVGGVDAVAPVDEVAPAGAVPVVDAVQAVAADLQAGRISLDQAVERLIDDAVSRQLGRALGTGPRAQALADELREVLRGYASNDPYLAAKIRRLFPAK